MTPALADVVSEVEARRRAGAIISLFLDFDGTLVPIAPDRTTPRLDGAPRDTLRRISTKPSVVTTIISGRALDDLYSRVRIQGCIYAGNHGLEIFGPNLSFVEPVAAGLREELERLCDTLNSQLCPIPGVSIEDKGLTISVHYRQAADADVARVRNVVSETVSSTGSVRFRAGRKVLDIVPQTDWHKGIAAQWINRHLGAGKSDIMSIYFGDDATDEDAFATLNDAITVKVGGCPSRAIYRVPDPEAVHEFLDWLADFKS